MADGAILHLFSLPIPESVKVNIVYRIKVQLNPYLLISFFSETLKAVKTKQGERKKSLKIKPFGWVIRKLERDGRFKFCFGLW